MLGQCPPNESSFLTQSDQEVAFWPKNSQFSKANSKKNSSKSSFIDFRTELAKGHAKLSLRPVVTTDDAVAACRIYEINVSALTGYGTLGVKHGQHYFNVEQNFFYQV
jgi:hypothetical protein